ncbi:MAG: hypothetical protein CMF69_04675 [Magnetovibrio sp.]|nr:hypothetical protein [Magnetovibrio sp.]|tara:strand:- start:664 stop:1083 length:420 start_codon:yes stop_codon:yes gene_type:complete
MNFLSKIFNGMGLLGFHGFLFLFTLGLISTSKDLALLITLFVLLLGTYSMHLKYKDCILSAWEKKYWEFHMVNVIGLLFIPCYDGSDKESSVLATTLLLMLFFVVIIKILIILITMLMDKISKNNKKRKKRKRYLDRRY